MVCRWVLSRRCKGQMGKHQARNDALQRCHGEMRDAVQTNETVAPPYLKNSSTWQLSRKSLMNLGEHVTCCGIRYLDMHRCDSASCPIMSDDQRRMEVRAG
jgi:hypothetical protein